MEIANVWLRLTKEGSDVPLKDVTPAQAMFLHILHQNNNGGLSFGEEFSKITVTGTAIVIDVPAVEEVREADYVTAAQPAVGEVGKPGYRAAIPPQMVKGAVLAEAVSAKTHPRTDAEELARLSRLYSGARDKKNEPVINSVWPDKFNPKLPQTFASIPWKTASQSGIETAPLNYATGNVATSAPGAK